MALASFLISFHTKAVSFYHDIHCRARSTDNKKLNLKYQVVILQTAHYWAINAGVLLGAPMHRGRVAFETIRLN